MKRHTKMKIMDVITCCAAFIIIMIFAAIMLFGGWSDDTLIYEKTERTIIDIEDIIGDKLEMENPGLDIDVNISVGTDD